MSKWRLSDNEDYPRYLPRRRTLRVQPAKVPRSLTNFFQALPQPVSSGQTDVSNLCRSDFLLCLLLMRHYYLFRDLPRHHRERSAWVDLDNTEHGSHRTPD